MIMPQTVVKHIAPIALALACFTGGAAAEPSCATNSIDQRIAGFEKASKQGRVDYRFAVKRHSDALSYIYLIVDTQRGYEAVKIIFLRGCQLPVRGPRLDAEIAAKMHFGSSLQALFAEEI